MKISKNAGLMSLLYLVAFASFAVPIAYMQTFLSQVGYDVMERGIILSGGALVAIVAQFFVGYLCDKYQSDKKFYNISLIIFVVATYVMYKVSNQVFFVHLIFASLVSGMERTVITVQDTWCLETDETCMKNYGAIRAFGAIGWMLGTPIGALVISKGGYEMIPFTFMILTVVNMIITIFMQDAQKHEKSVTITMNDVKTLLLDKKYVVVVLLFTVINIIATADMYTVIDKMIMLGAEEALIGARYSIQAFVELPLFFAGGYLLIKFGDYKIMMFGTFMYIVRFIGYAIVQTPEMMIVVALLQCVTYPLIMITSKTLVDDATPIHMRASGQTIASAFYVGVSMLVTPIFASYVSTLIGIDMTLLFIGLLGFVSLWLGIVYKRI